jgi:hypothetical protein
VFFRRIGALSRRCLLLAAEDFSQQGGSLRGGVLANLLFFLAQHVEQAVEGFPDHVLVEVELAGKEAAPGRARKHAVVLLDHSDVLHRAVHDGGESGGEIGGALPFEIVGGCGAAAGGSCGRHRRTCA